MKKYSVRELAETAGISVRTLHYYDQIGLLKPEYRAANDYRYYGDVSTVKLQQIMFFRELGFSLEEIGKIITSPESMCWKRCSLIVSCWRRRQRV